MVRNIRTDLRSAPGRRLAVVISVAIGSVLAGGVAHGQTVSALVLEKSGASVPDVQPYTEIRAGMTISLSDRARLVFQHYHTCRTVTVVGGEIRFKVKMYAIAGGTKEKEMWTPCPRRVILKDGGESAGILTRGLGWVTLPSRPDFVLVGPRAADFSSVRVSKGGTVLLEASLVSRRFTWPTDAAPLAAGHGYELVLIPAMAGTKPITMKFRVAASGLDQVAEGLLVIRVEEP